MRKQRFDVAAETARDPMATDRIGPRYKTDPLVSGSVQMINQGQCGRGVVGIDNI